MPSVRALRLKVPSWLETEGNGQRLLRPLMDDARLKMEYYRSQMKYLESKYKTTFSRFQKRVNSTMRKENTEEWDDYIEWEAMTAARDEWRRKYKDLLACLK